MVGLTLPEFWRPCTPPKVRGVSPMTAQGYDLLASDPRYTSTDFPAVIVIKCQQL